MIYTPLIFILLNTFCRFGVIEFNITDVKTIELDFGVKYPMKMKILSYFFIWV